MDVGFSELWLDVNRERPCLDEGEIPIFLAPIASEQVVDLSERRMHQFAVHSGPANMLESHASEFCGISCLGERWRCQDTILTKTWVNSCPGEGNIDIDTKKEVLV